MDKLKLTFACSPYDRIEPLRQKKVQPEGINLDTITDYGPRELFDRMMQTNEFDIAEMSSSEHIAMTCAGGSPFVALPVFPSKVFRHSFVVYNKARGISKPKDLEGKRIGVPLHTMTAAVWCRGVLEDDYGVDLSGVTWVQGSMNESGSHGNPNPPPLLQPVDIVQNTSGKSLNDLLVAGEIDATLGAVLPDALGRDPNIVRMWPNFRDVEMDYYKRTKIHPIMHIVVIRKDVYNKNPWIAKPLYQAFEASKRLAWQQLSYDGAQKVMLPWLYADLAEIREVFPGNDPWPYGIEANRNTLETQVRMMKRHYMIDREPSLDELFVTVN
ncbi:MAG: ABC transporter substrate-binding protein [Beijerinckiaceae bacterium]|jgi:4,5-dihydroxyphthalate decarboxylase|nr:ABC transporter substrate-binding protein [Beijerinckiaceae bacterium]